MYPFVPCRFSLISVLGCQWKSRAEKADGEWDRETAGNPGREVILICACLSVGKEDSCKSAEHAANMLSLERCSQSVWLKHVNPMARTRNRGFLFIYNSDLATSRKSRLWSREGGAVIEAVCFQWLFLRFLKGRIGLSVLKKKKVVSVWPLSEMMLEAELPARHVAVIDWGGNESRDHLNVTKSFGLIINITTELISMRIKLSSCRTSLHLGLALFLSHVHWCWISAVGLMLGSKAAPALVTHTSPGLSSNV